MHVVWVRLHVRVCRALKSMVRAYQFTGRWMVLVYTFVIVTFLWRVVNINILVDIALFIVFPLFCNCDSRYTLNHSVLTLKFLLTETRTHPCKNDQCWNIPDKDRWLTSINICLYCLSIANKLSSKKFAKENEEVGEPTICCPLSFAVWRRKFHINEPG